MDVKVAKVALVSGLAALALVGCAAKDRALTRGVELDGGGGTGGERSPGGPPGQLDGGRAGDDSGGRGGAVMTSFGGGNGPTVSPGGGSTTAAAGDRDAGTGGGGTAGIGMGTDAGAERGDLGADAPGGGPDPFVADVTPTQSGDVWKLAFGQVVFEVNAVDGASVTTYSRGGHNVLADGSRFRPSPQKTWTWPPPPEITQSSYAASLSGKVIVMDGQTSTQWGLKARKRFWANSLNEVVTLEYTLTNTSRAPASWAPWEVSRVNATGLTFFPEGDAIAPKPSSFGQPLALQSTAGVAWLDYQAALYTAGNYIVARDGSEGWSAHAEAGTVFIKSFPDVPAALIPPEEGEIQLWTDNTHIALEMENEGRYESLGAGQSIVWTVRWYLRTIPNDVPVAAGSAKLLEFVRSQLLR